MGLTYTSPGSIAKSVAQGDEFYRFSGTEDEATLTDPEINENVVGVLVGPNSDIDKFTLSYPNPNQPSGVNERIFISQKQPFYGRLPIAGISPAQLALSTERRADATLLAFGSPPVAEVIFLLKTPSGSPPGYRPPKFTAVGAVGAGGVETIMGQAYCFGRHRVYGIGSVAAGVAATVRVAGLKLNPGVGYFDATIASFVIGAGGGTFTFNNLCGAFDLVRLYVDGDGASASSTLEVRDEE